MKSILLTVCAFASTVLFLVFIGLYLYTWIEHPSPWDSSIAIGDSSAVIETNIFIVTNKATFYPHVIRVAVEKNEVKDMRGCNLVLFNQTIPYELNAMFAFDRGDQTINTIHLCGCGLVFMSVTHSARMLDCAPDDKTHETLFMGWGIYISSINHTVNKEQNWWTFFINLWYPIILFGILPAVCLFRRFFRRKSTPLQN